MLMMLCFKFSYYLKLIFTVDVSGMDAIESQIARRGMSPSRATDLDHTGS